MNLGFDFLSDVSPWCLWSDRPEPPPDGFLASGNGVAAFGTETELIRFTTTDRAVVLKSLCWFDVWGGSSTGRLIIRANGATVEEYFQQFTHDVEPSWNAMPIVATVPPRALVQVLFDNETDSGNPRNISLILSGYYEEVP